MKGFPYDRSRIFQRPGGSHVIMQSQPKAHYSSLPHRIWHYYVLLISFVTTAGGSSKQTCCSPGPVYSSWPLVQEVLFLNVNYELSDDSEDQ